MADYGVDASGDTIATAFGSITRDISLAMGPITVSLASTPTLLQYAESSVTIRWALVGLQLEVAPKGGTIRLQQEAKK